MEKICGGIILYNPEIERLKENIESIYYQVDFLILVDNNSKNIAEILMLIENYSNIELIRNKENKGIAYALNQLMDKSILYRYKWVLTLDQDSVCPNYMIESYLKYTNHDNIGIICPTIIDRNKKNFSLDKNKEFSEIEWCITSGSLMNTKIFKDVGRFDNKMFIDGVDEEYCIRLRKKKYTILRLSNVYLSHEIGSIEERKFLWFRVIVKNHSAFRKYYITRNIIYITKKHFTIKETLKGYMRIVKFFLITALYESERKQKIKEIIRGTKDAIKLKFHNN